MRRPKENVSKAGEEVVGRDIVERCRRGDEQAWSELVNQTYRGVYTLCLRILRDPDDAAEATQDAYVRAWRGLRRFRGDASMSTWLYRIATNTAISAYRARTRRQGHETGIEEEMLEATAPASSVEDTVGEGMAAAEIERAIASLPPHYAHAVLLRDVYGFGIDEIARRLKISSTAAKVRVHRGRKRLREALGDEER